MRKKENKSPSVMIIAIIMVIAIILALAVFIILQLKVAANSTKTFYAGTTVNSVDVSGLTAEEAESKLAALAADYSLKVTFADTEETLEGQQVALEVNPKNQLAALVKKQNKTLKAETSSEGLELTDDSLFLYDEAAVSDLISSWTELTELSGVEAMDASLVYNQNMGAFAVEPETVGGTIDPDALVSAIEEDLQTLTTSLNAVETGLYGREIRVADSDEMQQALSDANDKLRLKLTYTYSVPSADIYGKETINFDQLSQWLYVENDGITIGVEQEQLQNYCSEMYEAYSVHDNATSQFVTTGGDFVQVDVPACDETVDTDALFNDIVSAIDHMESGERQAPYASTSAGISGTTDLGGSYIEVDMDSQYLWLYKDHQVVAEGAICSGDVATGCATPGGLYTIKSMETDRWLNGADYHDWVSYWMPFNGGIGLHDATWRSEEEFGGNIYLESGSHGCINMPLDLARQVFENVDVGFYVILYGGVSSTTSSPSQAITATSEYAKRIGDGPFYLDAKSTGGGKLSYISSNTNVATVDEYGRVTIVGTGTATIRVTAEATDDYDKAAKDITIIVSDQATTSNNSGSTSGISSSNQKPSSSSDNTNSGSGTSKPSSGSTGGSASKPSSGTTGGGTSKPSSGTTGGSTSKPNSGSTGGGTSGSNPGSTSGNTSGSGSTSTGSSSTSGSGSGNSSSGSDNTGSGGNSSESNGSGSGGSSNTPSNGDTGDGGGSSGSDGNESGGAGSGSGSSSSGSGSSGGSESGDKGGNSSESGETAGGEVEQASSE